MVKMFTRDKPQSLIPAPPDWKAVFWYRVDDGNGEVVLQTQPILAFALCYVVEWADDRIIDHRNEIDEEFSKGHVIAMYPSYEDGQLEPVTNSDQFVGMLGPGDEIQDWQRTEALETVARIFPHWFKEETIWVTLEGGTKHEIKLKKQKGESNGKNHSDV